MILEVKDALDAISPDQALIYRTELLLMASHKRKKISLYKNLTIAATLLCVVGAFFVTGYVYYQTPVNYIDIDINPSLELGINSFDRVVDVRLFNDDAEALIEEDALRGRSPAEAVSLILAAAEDQGCLSSRKEGVVSLALCGSETKKCLALLESCSASITAQYTDVALYKAALPGEVREEADSESISAGKLYLIKRLQALDRTVTVSAYRDKSITEIFQRLTALSVEAGKRRVYDAES